MEGGAERLLESYWIKGTRRKWSTELTKKGLHEITERLKGQAQVFCINILAVTLVVFCWTVCLYPFCLLLEHFSSCQVSIRGLLACLNESCFFHIWLLSHEDFSFIKGNEGEWIWGRGEVWVVLEGVKGRETVVRMHCTRKKEREKERKGKIEKKPYINKMFANMFEKRVSQMPIPNL